MIRFQVFRIRCRLLWSVVRCAALCIALTSIAPVERATLADEGDPPQIRVMSFNVRYGTAEDGDNHWERRRDFLVDTIVSFSPDLLGTQETLSFQRDYLASKLTDYDVLGVGRDDGKENGEMMALYFRRDRFEKTAGGHFWLSETPDTIGSRSWDSSLPRMTTWVKLKDRRVPDAKPILFMNTHFDHRGAAARLESARLLRRQVTELGAGHAVIITGDFNAGEGSEPYVALFGESNMKPSPVVDTYRVIHPARDELEGTFTGFDPQSTKGARIDWIGVTRDWHIEGATIDRTMRDGRLPSDHFPVTAILRQ